MERGFAKISAAFHQISENVKRHEEQRWSKDDSYVVPMHSWKEFSQDSDNSLEGSISDSGLAVGKRYHNFTRSFSQYSKVSNMDVSFGSGHIADR